MRLTLMLILLLCLAAAAHAQQVVNPCTQVPGGSQGQPGCVPVSTAAPLPTSSN